jgi:uncharacterized protein GlcG (DUF336 family)
MKHIFTRLMATASVCLIAVASAAKADVEPATSIKVADQTLTLNGSGTRNKYFMQLYVGSLYLAAANDNAHEVIAADENMAIVLDITSGLITSEKMSDATIEGFEKALGKGYKAMEPRINDFLDSFSEAIKAGDQFVLGWDQSRQSVVVQKNGTEINVVKGLDFKQALFAIWIGERPAEKKLKKGMLGQ